MGITSAAANSKNSAKIIVLKRTLLVKISAFSRQSWYNHSIDFTFQRRLFSINRAQRLQAVAMGELSKRS